MTIRHIIISSMNTYKAPAWFRAYKFTDNECWLAYIVHIYGVHSFLKPYGIRRNTHQAYTYIFALYTLTLMSRNQLNKKLKLKVETSRYVIYYNNPKFLIFSSGGQTFFYLHGDPKLLTFSLGRQKIKILLYLHYYSHHI